MNKTKRVYALPLIATTVISAFTLSSCAQSDNGDNSDNGDTFTTAAGEGNSNSDSNNNSSEGKESIPDNIVVDDRGDEDFSPFVLKAKATKIADLPEGEGTRGLQFVDGRIYGHAVTDRKTGASRVYSVDPEGGDHKVVRDFGSLIDAYNDGLKSYEEPLTQKDINTDRYGLVLYKKPHSESYFAHAKMPGAEDGQWIQEAFKSEDGKVDGDNLPYKELEANGGAFNNCLNESMMEKSGSNFRFNVTTRGKSNLTLMSDDGFEEKDLELASGSTTDEEDDYFLDGATDCSFADDFLVTNIRNNSTFDDNSFDPESEDDEEMNPHLNHHSAKLALSMPKNHDHFPHYDNGLPKEYNVSFLVDLEGVDDKADVTALTTDPEDPNKVYVTMEGDSGLYEVDISSAHFTGKKDGNVVVEDIYFRLKD